MERYLKYKDKYITLKEHIGGTKPTLVTTNPINHDSFLSAFCGTPSLPSPSTFTIDDVRTDFFEFITKCENSKPPDLHVEYYMPEKFKLTFTKKIFFYEIILEILTKQMGCTQKEIKDTYRNMSFYDLDYKMFYFAKDKIEWAYNDTYTSTQKCSADDTPDCVILKLYVPKK